VSPAGVRGDVRIVVLGAGASGSELVRALATSGVAGPVLLVDDGCAPADDRVWASWRPVGDGPDDPSVSASWRRLVIATDHGERRLALLRHRYVVIRGRDLRAATDAALRSVSGERLAATAHGLHDDGDSAVVATNAGDVRAELVLDSTGLILAPAGPARAWMAFDGCEVESEGPTFDRDAVRLMDFRVPQRDGVAFVYTLPWAADRALVELARIAVGRQPAPASTGADLADHLDRALGEGRYRVLRRESGVLPLRPRVRRPRSAHCLAIGAGAGLVRASTGYGYQRMRRDGARIADQLARGERPSGLRRRGHHLAMDAVFLELAARDPGTLAESLEALFARNPADLVLRFLDESTSPREEARLVSSLPTWPFVAAALQAGVRAAAARGPDAGTGP
jgi:lycopene beta-cyclase